MSSYSDYMKSVAHKADDRFFGEGNKVMKTNKYFTFKHVLDNDTIIINTKNVRSVKGNPILVVGDNEAVYLKDWNVKPAHNFYEDSDFYLVKLSRAFFKVYTFKGRIDDGLSFDGKVDDFDSLLKVAEEQDNENMKVANGFMG